ncbi:chorismate mutase [uncultured Thermanaerothrix sp.]|uniref:chorismate mutase n=1 Tax=uncultured Thermanaerothrix sp. TaxID=1195149 RepID=UPI00263656B8|nr:chorismate mutase [uncultured Thermanaerothrix sp.]
MTLIAIRGAITCDENSAEAILSATHRLMSAIIEKNHLIPDHVISLIFSATPDLDAAYPAQAVRQMGWIQVPMLCLQEMKVANSLPRCLRVLIHYEANPPFAPCHVYLNAAQSLRPDWAQASG